MVGEIVFLVTKIPCNSISKRQDQTLNVRLNFTYKGPAITGRLGAVVTQQTILSEFDEIGSTRKEVSVNFPAATTAQLLATDITGMPLSGCAAKSGYGVKVYALDLDGKPEVGCLNVLTVTVGAPAEYTLEVTVEPPATGYVTKSPSKAKYSAGEVVTLTAYPYSGYEFDHWGGWPPYPGVGSTSPSIQITMDANWWVVAAFREVPAPPPPAVYTCSVCGATFNSQAELDAHIASAHPPTGQYWYRVTFIDGSVSDIPVPYDPVGHTSLWDIVDRNSVLSWVYLGFY